MIVFLTLIYVALLFVLMRMKVIPNTKAVWSTTGVWIVLLTIFLFIPMQWGAPSGQARVLTRVVQVVPNVSGQVVDIQTKPNVPMKQGDVLFNIDPVPFQQAVDLAEANLVRIKSQADQDLEALKSAEASLRQATAQEDLAQARFDDDKELVEKGVYSENRLERRESDLDQARAAVDSASAAVRRAESELGSIMPDGKVAKVAEAETRLEQALWNLDQTTVRAPVDGYSTNLALSVGHRVVNLPLAPSLAFVNTAETRPVAQIHQIYLRHVKPGQLVEMAMKTRPGHVIFGTVESVVPVVSGGQVQVSGSVAAATQVAAEPFMVRITVTDPSDNKFLGPGSVGTVAIYTETMGATHIIRKVMIRMTAIMNYLNPAL
ncbi:biotin/lipoyl-binding protein [Shimia thalassica]|uniref:HlyD family secretion protein n=1 Tax=Shimia thalassica TaxID=1715693 RepID=UPI002734051D|nr:biotin/lipoyl-binding protein [Shimia thalassica]MDP2578768.1 biotin/lipoyl-binding protein [Shimia thalassica]